MRVLVRMCMRCRWPSISPLPLDQTPETNVKTMHRDMNLSLALALTLSLAVSLSRSLSFCICLFFLLSLSLSISESSLKKVSECNAALMADVKPVFSTASRVTISSSSYRNRILHSPSSLAQPASLHSPSAAFSAGAAAGVYLYTPASLLEDGRTLQLGKTPAEGRIEGRIWRVRETYGEGSGGIRDRICALPLMWPVYAVMSSNSLRRGAI